MGGARGEGMIEFEGQELPVLLTNRAIAEAEKATGKTIIRLAQDANSGDIGMADIAALMRAGLEYGRRDAGVQRRTYTMADAYDVMDGCGFATAAKIVFTAVSSVLSYSSETDTRPPATARSETGA